MRFDLYFGGLLHGKMANENGFVSIAGVKVAVIEEMPFINTTDFEVKSFIQGHRVYHSIWQPKF